MFVICTVIVGVCIMLGDTVQVAVVLGDNVGCCINIINILFKE